MRRLKIAFLSRWFAEENRRTGTQEGGAIQQLAEAVAALGHEVIVLSQSQQVEELKRDYLGALEVWLSPREKRQGFTTALRDKWAKSTYGHRKVYSDAQVLGEFLRQRGPFDILWAHCEEPDGLVAAIAAQEGIALPPLLVQIQSLRYRFEMGKPVFNGAAALRLAFQRADRILANSELVAETLPIYAGGILDRAKLASKVQVVFPNLSHDFIRQSDQATLGASAEPNRFLFFGALNEKKGALIFLEALGRTTAAKSGATFVMAGGFTERNARFEKQWKAALAQAEQQVPPGKLEVLGKVSAEEAMRQIQRSSVVVLPSLFDEFSRALVEALILGRPVITTKTVGTWPLVTEHVCGLVVEPNDPAALAEAMDTMMHPQAHYAANAHQLAHRLIHEISPEAIALQLARHFAELALP